MRQTPDALRQVGRRDGVELAANVTKVRLPGSMQVEIKLSLTGDQFHTGNRQHFVWCTWHDRTARRKLPHQTMDMAGDRDDIRVCDGEAQASIRQIGMEITCERKIDQNGTKLPGTTTMEMEHIDFVGIDILNRKKDCGAAQIASELNDRVTP